jgi:hypothetical protein
MNTDGRDRRVFADTRRIALRDGAVVHRWHAARKELAPVIANDMPWEAAGVFVYGSALAEPDRLRLWYQARDRLGGNGHAVGYAESCDGIAWDKPELGLVDIDGSRRNNLVNMRMHLPSVGAHPDGGYWAAGHVWARASIHDLPDEQRKRPGVYRFRSDDGFDWAAQPGALWETPPGVDHPYGGGSDVHTVIRDAHRDRYIAATKFHFPYDAIHRRSFAIRTSPDLRTWSDPAMALVPDELDDQRARDLGMNHADFYGVSFHPYPEFILGFIWVFYMEGPQEETRWPTRTSYYGWQRHGHMAEIQPVLSYDGVYWSRPKGRVPLIATGDRGEWDGGNVALANHPVTIGNEHYHYYGGGPVHHGATTRLNGADRPPTGVFTSIGLARIKRDRYASFGSSSGGSVVAVHGPRQGSTLRINARATHGSVRVAVLDEAGNAFPGLGVNECQPFLGDDTDAEVHWDNSELSSIPEGTPFALRFVLEEADIFGYEIA